MKKIVFLTLALLMITMPASSTLLILADPVVTGSPGDYTWSYDVSLGPGSVLNPPGTPCTAIVPGGICDGLLTIYDFEGYVGGSISTTAAGWTSGTVQLVGLTPLALTPADDAGILNLSWTYTGTGVSNPTGSTVLLGTFSAKSIYNQVANTDYTGRTAFGTSTPPIRSANLDVTKAPTSVPEPATVLLFGTALLGLAVSVRRKIR